MEDSRWVVELRCDECTHSVLSRDGQRLECSHPQRKSDFGDGVHNIPLTPDDIAEGCTEGEKEVEVYRG